MNTTYDLSRSWEENAAAGPRFWTPEPDRLPGLANRQFLGLPVRSPIGIAAGLLANSRWLLPYARRGWDILTYKTVRSAARAAYPPPNWVFVETVDPGSDDTPVRVVANPDADPHRVSSSVCFGMPSPDPSEWREDVRRARQGLAPGQVLIVSVVGSPAPGADAAVLARDYARCAAWAAESGAQVVEANLSCPNVCTAEGTLYHDPELSRRVAAAIRSAVGKTPLLLKIGAFPDSAAQVRFLRAIDGVADGVTLVNGLTREVLHPDGRPAFGPTYRRAGILGRMIHASAVTAVAEAVGTIRRDQLDLEVAAVGGVADAADVDRFLDAGAHAVLAGSSPMYLPDLPTRLQPPAPQPPA